MSAGRGAGFGRVTQVLECSRRPRRRADAYVWQPPNRSACIETYSVVEDADTFAPVTTIGVDICAFCFKRVIEGASPHPKTSTLVT
jgi:hypothetical protein